MISGATLLLAALVAQSGEEPRPIEPLLEPPAKPALRAPQQEDAVVRPAGELVVPTADRIRAARIRGSGWLVAAQADDGGWGSALPPSAGVVIDAEAHASWRLACTGLAVQALLEVAASAGALGAGRDVAAASAAEAAAVRGLEWILADRVLVAPDPGPADAWGLVYAVEALARALSAGEASGVRRDALVAGAERAVARLEAQQGPQGGWSAFDPQAGGLASTTHVTAAAIVALQAARAAGLDVSDTVLDTGVAARRGARLPAGGFTHAIPSPSEPGPIDGRDSLQGSLARMQPAHLALLQSSPTASEGHDAVLTGLDAFFAHHRFLDLARHRPGFHEGFYETSAHAFTFGHAYAGRLLARLNAAERARYASRLAREVLTTQEPDGSWWDGPLFGYGRVYGTSFALIALGGALP